METNPVSKSKRQIKKEKSELRKRLKAQKEETILNHYREGKLTNKQIAIRLGIVTSTITRLAKLHKLGLRRNPNPVVGGMKKCNDCELNLPVTSFYKRKDGGFYSYCRECSCKRTLKVQRRERQARRNRKLRAIREAEETNQNSRKLLRKALELISQYWPRNDLVFDIQLHLKKFDEMKEERRQED